MHELSIASSIVEYAEEFAREHQANRISKIELEVGQLSGVVTDSLEFAMEEAIKGSVLEKAQVVIIEIIGQSICNQCQTEFANSDWYTPCPQCNSMDSEIVAGKELQIKSIVTA
ncbi:MAG: hydrogenase maturation nickel metallochaperone HypA [Bacteroidetes bacterium HGW-Bacteroidetes-6]|nr:MAG: hydrogenase maturation nickel metallochaperone HypA [Bacteroidetes bacterium HGW-Bacteroidetes-6]